MGVGVGVGWEGRKSQDIGCPILDADMQLLVVESGPLELRSVRSSSIRELSATSPTPHLPNSLHPLRGYLE